VSNPGWMLSRARLTTRRLVALQCATPEMEVSSTSPMGMRCFESSRGIRLRRLQCFPLLGVAESSVGRIPSSMVANSLGPHEVQWVRIQASRCGRTLHPAGIRVRIFLAARLNLPWTTGKGAGRVPLSCPASLVLAAPRDQSMPRLSRGPLHRRAASRWTQPRLLRRVLTAWAPPLRVGTARRSRLGGRIVLHSAALSARSTSSSTMTPPNDQDR